MTPKTETKQNPDMTAGKILERKFGGSKNGFTPDILRYGKIRKLTAYELSEGDWKGAIFGVSVVILNDDLTPNAYLSDKMSRAFPPTDVNTRTQTKAQAEAYITKLSTIAKNKDWKGTLDEFLTIGQEVDEDLYDYFLGVLPPATNTSKCLQIGEPYDTNPQGHSTYSTLMHIDGAWLWAGHRAIPEHWIY